MERLRHRIKGNDVLSLVGRILAAHGGGSGQGLPIGALTSQCLANYYLDPLDRFLLEESADAGIRAVHGRLRLLDRESPGCDPARPRSGRIPEAEPGVDRESTRSNQPKRPGESRSADSGSCRAQFTWVDEESAGIWKRDAVARPPTRPGPSTRPNCNEPTTRPWPSQPMPIPGHGFWREPRTGLESTGLIGSNTPGKSVGASAPRVLRGGSWNNDARNVRAAYRNHNEPSNRNHNLGFRCAELTTEPDGSLLNRPASCPSFRATANASRRPAC